MPAVLRMACPSRTGSARASNRPVEKCGRGPTLPTPMLLRQQLAQRVGDARAADLDLLLWSAGFVDLDGIDKGVGNPLGRAGRRWILQQRSQCALGRRIEVF